jgi:leucyl/phenylalanyl-tRNA--protein transferase
MIAVGGDLEPRDPHQCVSPRVFSDGRDGPRRKLGWWSPEPRGIVPPDRLRVTQSMAAERRRFEIRVDTLFPPTSCARACDPTRE